MNDRIPTPLRKLAQWRVGVLLLQSKPTWDDPLSWFGSTVHVGDKVWSLGRRAFSPRLVELRGLTGRPVELVFHGRNPTLTISYDEAWKGKLTVGALRVLAMMAAGRLDAPYHDELDDRSWSLWQSDPSYRRRLRFDTEVAGFHKAHAKWAAQPPAEPRRVQYEHDYLHYAGFVITREGFFYANRALWLKDVLDVATIVRGGRLYLLVLTPDGSRRYGHREPTTGAVRSYRWLEEQLRLAASNATALDRGNRADVPSELHGLRR